MKPIKRFMNYLERELPEGYYAKCSPDGEEVTILNNGGYIYLFYRQEIEEDFELYCSMAQDIIKLAEK